MSAPSRRIARIGASWAVIALAGCGGSGSGPDATASATGTATPAAADAIDAAASTGHRSVAERAHRVVASGAASTSTATAIPEGPPTQSTGGTAYAGRAWFVDSTTGRDAADGSAAAPWKTLARAGGQTLAVGDAVLLKCGSAWRESFTLSTKNAPAGGATLGAWGDCKSSPLPVISGADVVTGVSWTPVASAGGSPVYAAPWAKPVSTLYWNGAPLTRARYPNNGGIGHEFGLIASMRTARTFVPAPADAAVLRALSLAGTTVFIRTNPWLVESQDVAGSDSTGAVTLKAATTFAPQAGEGFFVEGALALLDTAGEWFHDATTGTLYVWAPNGRSPATGLLETAQRSVGVTVSNVAATRVDKLAFDRQTGPSLDVVDAQRTTITEVSSSGAGSSGIVIEGVTAAQSSGSSVERATIANAGTTGIHVDSPSVRIVGSSIDGSGSSPTSSGVSAGVLLKSAGGSVLDSRISNSAFAAVVLVNATGATVSGNTLTQACRRFTDCGAIYSGGAPTAARRTTIASNTITDLVPNPEGAVGGATTLVAGIYLDEASATHDVTNNMIVRTNVGINLHNSSNHVVQLNHVWLAERASIRVHNSSSTETVRGNLIQDNELYGSAQLTASLPATTAPSLHQVYPQEWVHGTDAALMFTGANPNMSRRNVAATMTSPALARWSLIGGWTQQTLDLSQWSAYASGETVKAAYAARPFLVTAGGANLIRNSAFQSAGTDWLFWSASPAAGGTVKYGTCGTTGCSDFATGSMSDFLISDTFQMSSAPGANLYSLRVRAQGLSTQAGLTLAINREGGDGADLGLVLMNQAVSNTLQTSIDALFNATSSDVARLNMTGAAGKSIRLRDVAVAPVRAYELLTPGQESALLTNETSNAKSLACPATALRTCNVADLAGQAITWPVVLAANTAKVVVSNDAKWKP